MINSSTEQFSGRFAAPFRHPIFAGESVDLLAFPGFAPLFQSAHHPYSGHCRALRGVGNDQYVLSVGFRRNPDMNRDRFKPAHFRKASRSGDIACVEVAFIENEVGVRDSKHREGEILSVTPGAWGAFVQNVKKGAFDLPV
jgi:hypothetical protein